jgi:nucleotide-binding universal stress UspA family protein
VITLTNILVATDFSEPSAAALTYGRALAGHFRYMLHVVHVVGTIPCVYGAEAYVVSVPDLQQQLEDAARKELDALAIDSGELPLFRRVLITSQVPAAAIVDYAKQERVGLIVAGTHGRGAVAHALIGSVAERIVRTAPCPVLTVRHPEHEFVVPDTFIANATGLTRDATGQEL